MRYCLYFLLCVLATTACGAPSAAQIELVYAKRLQQLGFPDYAEHVLDRVKTEAGDDYYPLKISMMVGTKKGIGEAERLLDSMDPAARGTWQMKLAMADGYFAWGKYDKVKTIYSAYLKTFAKSRKGIEEAYKGAAFKYAQMLEMMGDLPGAVEAYDIALASSLAKHEKRQVIAGKAEILVRMAEAETDDVHREELCARIDELCSHLLWVQDLWFGRAIVMKAHVKMLRGDNEGTIAMLEEYMPILKQIDISLREQERAGRIVQ